MSVEEFFTKIHEAGVFEKVYWENVIWFVGMVNPCFMIPQLVKIWKTRTTEGISLITFTILFLLQGAFSIHGIYLKDLPLFLSNGAAATMTFITSISVIYFRWFRK
ncbi:MAG: PQ-loop domain-containing transporter [bacterium]|nr:PQ-loop domain-containing transporter [bacterium]